MTAIINTINYPLKYINSKLKRKIVVAPPDEDDEEDDEDGEYEAVCVRSDGVQERGAGNVKLKRKIVVEPPDEDDEEDDSDDSELQYAKDGLTIVFNAFGINPESLIEDIVRDPYNFKNDQRPIVKDLCSAVINRDKFDKEVVTQKATESLNHLKEYFDQRIDVISNKTNTMLRHLVTVSDQRDMLAMVTCCTRSYHKAHTKFINSLRDVVQKDVQTLGDPHDNCSNLCSPYDVILMRIHSSKSKTITPEILKEVSRIDNYSMYTNTYANLDCLRRLIYNYPPAWGMFPDKLPSRFRDEGIRELKEQMLQDYKEYNDPLDITDKSKGFTGYCFEVYPKVVEDSFYFNGDYIKDGAKAYVRLVNDWKNLTDDERNKWY
jgi:hypothetical protein